MCSVHEGLSMLLLKGNSCLNMARNASQYEGPPCPSCSLVVDYYIIHSLWLSRQWQGQSLTKLYLGILKAECSTNVLSVQSRSHKFLYLKAGLIIYAALVTFSLCSTEPFRYSIIASDFHLPWTAITSLGTPASHKAVAPTLRNECGE